MPAGIATTCARRVGKRAQGGGSPVGSSGQLLAVRCLYQVSSIDTLEKPSDRLSPHGQPPHGIGVGSVLALSATTTMCNCGTADRTQHIRMMTSTLHSTPSLTFPRDSSTHVRSHLPRLKLGACPQCRDTRRVRASALGDLMGSTCRSASRCQPASRRSLRPERFSRRRLAAEAASGRTRT